MERKKIFSKSGITNLLFVIIILVMLLVPSAKAFMIRGLMEIGLFRPAVGKTEKVEAALPVQNLAGIVFKDASGKSLDLGSLKGKVVFLNFWATWCPPCLAELPSIQEAWQTFKDDPDFVFILVDADGKLAETHKFMKKKGYDFPLYSAASAVPENLFSGALPTTIVFDKQGRISYQESGAANYASPRFTEFMKKLKN
ncbi:thioredoxin, putative [Pedobacter sp. BAL39]|uniref:TlpA family protein disulfide reductase n=1 Tax=Pedobacter sp. BAL39 TaxID=391596 RepID=UPI0001559730|nr:TlpA disulfide reductase family protein [Pedobacter sp. BAL39]EDM36285.1 thioredoxin, putative [Pedobacter sp. BAL39]